MTETFRPFVARVANEQDLPESVESLHARMTCLIGHRIAWSSSPLRHDLNNMVVE